MLQPVVSNAVPTFPRPELSRPARGEEAWLLVEDEWLRGVDTNGDGQPNLWPENAETIEKGETLWHSVWHKQTIVVPKSWDAGRVLLHGGEQVGKIQLNGSDLALPTKTGNPFTLDISDALVPGDEQELMVSTEPGSEPGDQFWLEPVPTSYVVDAFTVPDPDLGAVLVHIDAALSGTALLAVQLVDAKQRIVASANVGLSYGGADSGIDREVSTAVKLPLPNPHLWASDSPYLYGLRVELKQEGKKVDSIESSFGVRQISVESVDRRGAIVLNYERWFPLMLRCEAEALPEANAIREMGFNAVHIQGKAMSSAFYQDCNEIGLPVVQEIGSSGELALKETVDRLRHHPCVVAWIPTEQVVQSTRWLRYYDRGRLIVAESGEARISPADKFLPKPDPLERAVILSFVGGRSKKAQSVALESVRAALKHGIAGASCRFEDGLPEASEATKLLQDAFLEKAGAP